MVHKRTRHVISLLLFTVLAGSVSAGDAARFVNLGFSPDSRTFMFAQHGIDHENGFPFAEIFTVDVPGNSFVANGVKRETYHTHLSPGQDGSGALYNLLPDLQPVVERYRIDHLVQGRLIYLLVDGDEVRDNLSFRDFETGNAFNVRLIQDRRGSGDEVEAAFHIELAVTLANGTVLTHQVGRPGYYREDIDRYRIKQIIASPDERSIVAVVERIRDTETGRRIRYMVETVQLR